MKKHTYVYITLLSSVDYLPAVLVLNESLKRVHSRYPLGVGVTLDILDKVNSILTKAGCIVYPIGKLEYNDQSKDFNAKHNFPACVNNTASKISLFTLHNIDKCVYIDADTLVLRNVDELFYYPDGSMVYYKGDPMGFTGLMVFSPRNHKYEFYKAAMDKAICTDGNLLGELWFFVKYNATYQIPSTYLVNYCPDLDDLHHDDYKILHFCNNPKPWTPEFKLNDQLWFQHYYKELLDTITNTYLRNSPLA